MIKLIKQKHKKEQNTEHLKKEEKKVEEDKLTVQKRVDKIGKELSFLLNIKKTHKAEQTQQEEEAAEDLSRESLSLLYVMVEKDRKIEMGWV